MKLFSHLVIAITFLIIIPNAFARVNPDSGLVAYFPFNGNADDESGNGYHGIVNGATLTSDRFNNPNKAYQFNGTGTGTNITLSNSTNLDFIENSYGKPFSLSAWAKQGPNTGEVMLIVGKHNCGTYGGYLLLTQNGNFGFWTAVNGNSWVQLTTSETFSDDNWHHVVAAYDGVNQKIYVDGVLKGTLASAYNSPATGAHVKIGEPVGCSGQHIFNGKLDEIRIYNYALSYAQVLQLYQNESTGLVAYFPFNGNTNDESGNMNDGVNHNASFAMDRYGIDNSSLFFATGIESYVEGMNPGNNLPIGNSPRTFSAWINTGVYNQYGSNIFHYGTQQQAPTNFHFLITDVLGLGNGYGYGVVYSNQNVIDGFWHFVAGVYEGGNERITKLFVDGKLDASGTISTEPNTTLGTNWRMGRFMEGSSNFQGFLDEVRIYNVALTAQEIWDLYQSTTTAPNLLFPINNSNINTLTPVLEWDSLITAFDYRLEIAIDSLFINSLLYQVVPQKTFQVPAGILFSDSMYYWRVRAATNGGVGPWSEAFSFNIVITDVEDEQQIPTEFVLIQNYPNPFNPSTTIRYSIPSNVKGQMSNVILKVYDVLGNEVATLINEEKPAGNYEIEFRPESNIRNPASGVYFYQLKAGNYIETRKMILMK